MDDLPELSKIQKSVIVGEGIAELVTTPEGREFLSEVLTRHQPSSVMDLPVRDLVRAGFLADRIAAARDLVMRHVKPTDPRMLGEVMPQLPEEIRELVVDHLLHAGLS